MEKEEPIKIHELINNNEQLNMSNDNEMNVMCIFCFNPVCTVHILKFTTIPINKISEKS